MRAGESQAARRRSIAAPGTPKVRRRRLPRRCCRPARSACRQLGPKCRTGGAVSRSTSSARAPMTP
eukprot:6031133-Lingulodinium_polyedra.AAC.1